MTSRSLLSWNNLSERGILASGWNPCQTGDFSFDVIPNGKVIAVYEDLRPGPVACALFCLPPLVAFAPICCPLLSMTSRAYCWEFTIRPKSDNQVDCLFRTKTFFSEDITTIYGVQSIRLESKQKVHVESDSSGQLKQQSIVVHQVVMEHESGTYEFPRDIPHGYQLQSFVAAASRLIHPMSPVEEITDISRECVHVFPCPVDLDALSCPTDVTQTRTSSREPSDEAQEDTTTSKRSSPHGGPSRCVADRPYYDHDAVVARTMTVDMSTHRASAGMVVPEAVLSPSEVVCRCHFPQDVDR